VRELSLHILDIAENSIASKAEHISIEIFEDTKADYLRLTIKDDGCGMDAEMLKKVVDPFVTSRTTRKVGLGIPLLKAAAEACNGYFLMSSSVGFGTSLTVQFQRSHIDRMPLGDVATTFLNLLVANPQVHWLFNYRFDDGFYEFDDKPVKLEIGDMPMTEPFILVCLREMLEAGIRDLQLNAQYQNASISN
jgi:hypothetical protein